jgi:hypothetical protein
LTFYGVRLEGRLTHAGSVVLGGCYTRGASIQKTKKIIDCQLCPHGCACIQVLVGRDSVGGRNALPASLQKPAVEITKSAVARRTFSLSLRLGLSVPTSPT